MNIDKLIKLATLEKNGAAKEAYRAIKNELLLNESSKKPKSAGKVVYYFAFPDEPNEVYEITELDFQVISKLIKQREESAAIYETNGRRGLAAVEKEQLKYLRPLLPPEISESRILEGITTFYPSGYSQKEMGQVIKKIKETFPTADGKLISKVVKENIL